MTSTTPVTLVSKAAHPVVIYGETSGGVPTPLLVDASGNLSTATANGSTTAATRTQVLKTVAAAGTPEAMAAVSTLVESVAIRPKKTRTTANTGNIYIQTAVTNDMAGGWELTPTDAPLVLSAPAGKKIDLATIFIDVATDGDGVIYMTVN